MSEWKEFRLGDICDVYDGPHATPPKLESGFVFLGISSLGFDGRINSAHFEYVSEESFKKWTRRVEPRHQDIVFSYETKLGVAAMIPQGFKCCLGRRMGLLRPKDSVDPKFLLYAYLAPDFQKTIYERTFHGSTVDRIPLKDMPDFSIRLPLYPEQKAIAQVLSSLDDKIGLLHRQNKTLEAIAETLFRQWFIEEAQDDWEVETLKSYLDIGIGRTPPRKEHQWFSNDQTDVKWISIKDLGNDGAYIFNTTEYLTQDAVEKFNIPLIPENTVLLSFKMTVGRVAITTEQMLSNEAIAHFKFRSDTPFTVEYLYLYLKNYQYDLLGSTSTIVTSINSAMIKDMEIVIHPKTLMAKFDNIVKGLFKKIKGNQKQIQTLEKLRDTLLPKLMSGEVRVQLTP
jgi:type I restriction enzyme S subunit